MSALTPQQAERLDQALAHLHTLRERRLERWLCAAGVLLITGIVAMMVAVGSGSAQWFLVGISAFVFACIIFIGVCLAQRKGVSQ